MNIHVVQPGDNLNSIASQYNTSVNRIIQDNGLENPNTLVVGQSIVIATPSQIHIVKNGDSLSSIANRYGISIM